ncbi:Protein of unknown function [Gryllus bimaculatus]|nr:Protein of unknown function [Gryllus bimaculatus]
MHTDGRTVGRTIARTDGGMTDGRTDGQTDVGMVERNDNPRSRGFEPSTRAVGHVLLNDSGACVRRTAEDVLLTVLCVVLGRLALFFMIEQVLSVNKWVRSPRTREGLPEAPRGTHDHQKEAIRVVTKEN